MKTIIVILLMAFSANTLANDASIYLGGWSRHYFVKGGDGSTLNENHNIIAIERNNWVMGYFENSYHEDSGMIARKYHLMSNNQWSLDVALGATYGYRTCSMKDDFYPVNADKKWCPAIIPELRYTRFERVQPSIMLVSGAVALTFKIAL